MNKKVREKPKKIENNFFVLYQKFEGVWSLEFIHAASLPQILQSYLVF